MTAPTSAPGWTTTRRPAWPPARWRPPCSTPPSPTGSSRRRRPRSGRPARRRPRLTGLHALVARAPAVQRLGEPGGGCERLRPDQLGLEPGLAGDEIAAGVPYGRPAAQQRRE